MSEREAFLAAIIRRPDDDVPRLIFADYLDERGESARAELIRLQCAAARGEPVPSGRIAELCAQHQAEWLAPLGRGVYHAEFRRGFPEHVVISARDFLRDGDLIRAQTPLRSVALLNAGRVLARLLTQNHLKGLAALHLTGGMLGDAGVERLVECPHLAGLTTLRLGYNEISDDGAAAIAASPTMANLRVLVLSHNAIGDAGVWELARSPILGRLRALDLSANEISPSALAILQNSPWLDQLVELSADDQRPTVRWRIPALFAPKPDEPILSRE